MFDLLSDYTVWVSFFTLTFMEIVLGIDNILFISLATQTLPTEKARRARQLGLILALVLRISMLVTIGWIIGFSEPVIELWGLAISWRDIILAGGGIFLMYKATMEISGTVMGVQQSQAKIATGYGFGVVVAEIAVIDLVFSFDSILTAIGLAQHLEVMIGAIIIAIIFMYLASEPASILLKRHPAAKMLALCFLFLIGFVLLLDGVGLHIPRGYIYVAILFSVVVQSLNELMFWRKKRSQGVRD